MTHQLCLELARVGRTGRKMATKLAIAKLHAVTLIRSPIRCNPKIRQTLTALGLTRMHKVVVHKNTPEINGMLRRVIQCVNVQPVVFNPTSAVSEATAATAVGGKRAFFAPNGVVKGISEREFIQQA